MAEHDSKERIVPFTHETAKRRYLDYRNDIRVAAFAYGLKLDVDGSKGLAEVYASVIDGEKDPSDIVSLAGLSGDGLQRAEKAAPKWAVCRFYRFGRFGIICGFSTSTRGQWG